MWFSKNQEAAYLCVCTILQIRHDLQKSAFLHKNQLWYKNVFCKNMFCKKAAFLQNDILQKSSRFT